MLRILFWLRFPLLALLLVWHLPAAAQGGAAGKEDNVGRKLAEFKSRLSASTDAQTRYYTIISLRALVRDRDDKQIMEALPILLTAERADYRYQPRNYMPEDDDDDSDQYDDGDDDDDSEYKDEDKENRRAYESNSSDDKFAVMSHVFLLEAIGLLLGKFHEEMGDDDFTTAMAVLTDDLGHGIWNVVAAAATGLQHVGAAAPETVPRLLIKALDDNKKLRQETYKGMNHKADEAILKAIGAIGPGAADVALQPIVERLEQILNQADDAERERWQSVNLEKTALDTLEALGEAALADLVRLAIRFLSFRKAIKQGGYSEQFRIQRHAAETLARLKPKLTSRPELLRATQKGLAAAIKRLETEKQKKSTPQFNYDSDFDKTIKALQAAADQLEDDE